MGGRGWWGGLAVALCGVGVAGAEPPPPQVGVLGIWDRAAPALERASRTAGVPVRFLSRPFDEAELEGLQVLLVLNLESLEARGLAAAARARPALQVVALDARDSQQPLLAAGRLVRDPKLPLYWRANGPINLARLLGYVQVRWLGGSGTAEPPLAVPDRGFYVPGRAEPLTELAALKKHDWLEGAPTAALVVHSSFLLTGDTAVIDALYAALRAEGMNVACVFADDPRVLRDWLIALAPDVVVEDRHGDMPENEGEPLAERLDAPRLRPISMLAYTQAQWEADPQGLHPRDRSLFLTLQERHGTIEPVVVGALKVNTSGFRLHAPVPGQVERFAARAAAWVRLRRTPNAEKRVVIVYYNKGLGQDDLMRGSPTGAFLDAPESAVSLLRAMQREGYRLDTLPPDAAALLERVKASGLNLGPWAQGELDRMADHPDVTLVPAATYQRWFEERLDAAQRAAVVAAHGPPPGRLMVVQRNGAPHLVLPGVRLGPGVLLAPQPERGEKVDAALLHSPEVPPPHSYLAFYWWLQSEHRAHAVIHFGTHGSLELLPGKEAGLHPRDWSSVCVGELPVINPWIMDNLGEATLSRRRAYAALVDHLPPAATRPGLEGDLLRIDEDIERLHGLEAGVLRERFRAALTEAVRAARLHEPLGLPAEGPPLTDAEIQQVHDQLHRLEGEHTPTRLHVLGVAPDAEALAEWSVPMLRAQFRERLGRVLSVPAAQDRDAAHREAWLRGQTEALVRGSVLGTAPYPAALKRDARLGQALDRLRETHQRVRAVEAEIGGILRALAGRFVPPGPGPDPARNPGSVPSGRNLFALNPEAIPMRPAWEVGQQLAAAIVAQGPPAKVGFDLNGMNTLRDFGVIEAQILALIGVRPVWDEAELVVDVALIPRAELGRPRIDVFVAMGGQYKENFPTRVKLLAKAVALAAAADEPDNGVRAGSAALEARLLERGFSGAKARAMGQVRVFGTKPGHLSGTNILYLVPRSGAWTDRAQIAQVYIDSMRYAYGGGAWGEPVEGLYEAAIQGTDTLVRAWASNMTSQLSNHHAYEYLGGLSLAVETLTGQSPRALIADVRDPSGGTLRRFEEVIDTSLRVELLNPKWIRGMQANGYAGAGMMAELTRNTFGWKVTRPEAISPGVFAEISAVYVADKHHLDLRAWFERTNPHAELEILAVLLEADRKGHWAPDAAERAALAQRYAEGVVAHGPAGLVSGGNAALDAHVRAALDDAALAAAYQAAVDRAAAPAEGPEKVSGPALEPTASPQAGAAGEGSGRPLAYGLGAALLALLAWGAWRRAGQLS